MFALWQGIKGVTIDDGLMVACFVVGMVGLYISFCLLMALLERADNWYSFVGGLAVFGYVCNTIKHTIIQTSNKHIHPHTLSNIK